MNWRSDRNRRMLCVSVRRRSTPAQPINNDATSSAPELAAERVFEEADGWLATDQ